MPFPSSPIDQQVYGSYIYNAALGAWEQNFATDGGGGGGDASSSSIEKIADTGLSVNRVVKLLSNGNVDLVSYTDEDVDKIIGVSTDSVAQDAQVSILRSGTREGFTLVQGDTYYLGLNGLITNDLSEIDTSLGKVIKIGTASNATDLLVDISISTEQIKDIETKVGTAAQGKRSIGMYFSSENDAEDGAFKFRFGVPVLITDHQELFDRVGHKFHAMQVAAGETSLAPLDTSLVFYPTPIPGYTPSSGAEYKMTADSNVIAANQISANESFTNAQLQAGWGVDSPKGIPVLVEATSGSLPSGLTEWELYWIRFNAGQVSFHPTEQDALDNTAIVTLTAQTGQMTLHPAYAENSMQGHRHQLEDNSGNLLKRTPQGSTTVNNSLTDASASPDSTWKAGSLVSDNDNSGNPRTSNRTRPNQVHTNWFIQYAEVDYTPQAIAELEAKVALVSSGNREIGAIFQSFAESVPGAIKIEIGAKALQAEESALFTIVGHRFNSAQMALGQPDLSGSMTEFYTTPAPGSNTIPGFPTLQASSANVSSNVLTYDNGNVSPEAISAIIKADNPYGVPVIVKLISGSLPTGLTNWSQYYVRFIGSDPQREVRFYLTEQDAVEGNTPVTISASTGTLELLPGWTGNAFQDHWHRIHFHTGTSGSDQNISGDATGAGLGSQANRVANLVVDELTPEPNSGTPRPSNRTHGNELYANGFVQARHVTQDISRITELEEKIGVAAAGNKSIGEIFQSFASEVDGAEQVAIGKKGLISEHQELWNKIGHLFNSSQMALGEADLSGSSLEFYITPAPGSSLVSGLPTMILDSNDVAGTQIAITEGAITEAQAQAMFGIDQAHALPVIVEPLTGGLPGLNAWQQYWIRIVDGTPTRISFYETEQAAIDGNPSVFISAKTGKFKVRAGWVKNAFQGHWHEVASGATGASAEIYTPTTGSFKENTFTDVREGIRAIDAVDDGVNGTPRTANRTRGNELGANFFVQVKHTSTEILSNVELKERLVALENRGQREIGEVFHSFANYHRGARKFEIGAKESITAFPTYYNLMGHIFNASQVAGGQADLIGTNEFYVTPFPGHNILSFIPDIILDGTDDMNNGYAIVNPYTISEYASIMKTDSPVGVPMIVQSVNGENTGSLVEWTQYFVSIVDDSGIRIKFYNSESDAISDTDAVSLSPGSGQIKLRAGFADNALQGHKHEYTEAGVFGTGGDGLWHVKNGNGLAAGADNASVISANGVLNPTSDSVNGTPRLSNRTRGNELYANAFIQIESVPFNAPILSELYEESDWFPFPLDNTTTLYEFRKVTFPDPNKVIAKIMFKSDETGITDITNMSMSAAQNLGQSIINITPTSAEFRVAIGGGILIQPSDGNLTEPIALTNPEVKLVFQSTEVQVNQNTLIVDSISLDITSASRVAKLSDYETQDTGYEVVVAVRGGDGTGTNLGTLETGYNVGGVPASQWNWKGRGSLHLKLNTATKNWQPIGDGIYDLYYVDYAGTPYPQEKYINGKIEQKGFFQADNVTRQAMWDFFDPILVNIGEVLLISGGLGNTTSDASARIRRNSAIEMQIEYQSDSGGQQSATFTSTGGGDFAETRDVAISFISQNTKWSSQDIEVGNIPQRVEVASLEQALIPTQSVNAAPTYHLNYEISSSSSAIDLSPYTNFEDGTNVIIDVRGGDGLGVNIASIQAMSATVGEAPADDWDWLGEGNLHLRYDKPNNNFVVVTNGIFDRYTITQNDVDYLQEKFTDGKIIRRGSYYAPGPLTQGQWFNNFASEIPNVGEYLTYSGGVETGGVPLTRLYRESVTTMRSRGGNSLVESVFTDGSGAIVINNHVSVDWETGNTRWTLNNVRVGHAQPMAESNNATLTEAVAISDWKVWPATDTGGVREQFVFSNTNFNDPSEVIGVIWLRADGLNPVRIDNILVQEGSVVYGQSLADITTNSVYLQIAEDGGRYLTASGTLAAINSLSNPEYKIVLRALDVKALNPEDRVITTDDRDISSAGYEVDMTPYDLFEDNSEFLFTAHSGDRTYKMTFANTSYTIGGIPASEWSIEGKGGLHLRLDKTNGDYNVLNSGKYDTYPETYNGIVYYQEKYTDGSLKASSEVRGTGSVTYGSIFDSLKTIIPNDNEVALLSGSFGSWAAFSRAVRINSTTIDLYSRETDSSEIVTSITDGSSTVLSTAGTEITAIAQNSHWTTLYAQMNNMFYSRRPVIVQENIIVEAAVQAPTVTEFTTGWITPYADGSDNTILHNLNVPIDELEIRIFARSDSNLSREISNTNFIDAAHHGVEFVEIDENQVSAQVAANGIVAMRGVDNLYVTVDDGSFGANPQIKIDIVPKAPEINIPTEALSIAGINQLALAPIPKLDTGWTANNDWVDEAIPIDYSAVTGLSGLTLKDLDIEFLLSQTGDDTSQEILIDIDASTGSTWFYGIKIKQNGTDQLEIRTGDDGVRWLGDDGTPFSLDTEAWYYRVIIRPKEHTTLATFQNNGGYNNENLIDLSSPVPAIDLTTFFARSEGFIESWVWSNGNGTNELRFDAGDLLGMFIGGVSANLVVADLVGSGTGRLTLRKDGSYARLLDYHDSDGGNFTYNWEKDHKGILEQWGEVTVNPTLAVSLDLDYVNTTYKVSPDVQAGSARHATYSTKTVSGFTLHGWQDNGTTANLTMTFSTKGRWTDQYLEAEIIQSSFEGAESNPYNLNIGTPALQTAPQYVMDWFSVPANGSETPIVHNLNLPYEDLSYRIFYRSNENAAVQDVTDNTNDSADVGTSSRFQILTSNDDNSMNLQIGIQGLSIVQYSDNTLRNGGGDTNSQLKIVIWKTLNTDVAMVPTLGESGIRNNQRIQKSGWRPFPLGGTIESFVFSEPFPDVESVIAKILFRADGVPIQDITNMTYDTGSATQDAGQTLLNLTNTSISMRVGDADGVNMNVNGQMSYINANETNPEYQIVVQDLESVVSVPVGKISLDPAGTYQQQEAPVFDTGWINNSDWTNFTPNHDYSAYFPGVSITELDIRIYMSPDGTNANAFLFEGSSHDNTSIQLGWQFFQGSGDSIDLQTGAGGIGTLFKGTGLYYNIDTESYYYRLVMVKKNNTALTILQTNGDVALSTIPQFDSGWIQQTDPWNGANFPAFYGSVPGLQGLKLPELDVSLLISETGSDDDAFELGDTNNTTTSQFGYKIIQNGQDNIVIRLGPNGLSFVNESNGLNGLDDENWYYRIIVTPKIWTDLAVIPDPNYEVQPFYETDWMAYPGASSDTVINHNMNRDYGITQFTDLAFEVWARADGKQEQRITDNTMNFGNEYGQAFEQVDSDNALLMVGTGGMVALNAANGWNSLGTGDYATNPEIKVKVKKDTPRDLVVPVSNIQIDPGIEYENPDSPTYDSDWVQEASWSNQNFVHDYSNIPGLAGLTLAELDVDFLISTDGTDTNAFRPGDVALIDSGVARYGYAVWQGTTANTIEIVTDAENIRFIDRNHNQANTGAGYYQRVIIKPKEKKKLEIYNVDGTIANSPNPSFESSWFGYPGGNTDTPINHNLGITEENWTDYSYKIFLRADGIPIQDITYLQNESSSGDNNGQTILYVDPNNVELTFLSNVGLRIVDSTNGYGSIGSLTNAEIKVKIWKTLGSDVALLQNNGGYDREYVDIISGANAAPHNLMTELFNQLDGYIVTYSWSGGDTTFNTSWTVDPAYTIGGVDGPTLLATLLGEGQGRLTLRKDGTNARILEYHDQWIETSDGIDFVQKKFLDGSMDRSLAIRGNNVTRATLWAAMSPAIPNIGGVLLVSGSMGTGSSVDPSRFERTATDTITMYYQNSSGTLESATITDVGGTLSDLNEFDTVLHSKNARWTTLLPEYESTFVRDGIALRVDPINGNLVLSAPPEYDSGWIANPTPSSQVPIAHNFNSLHSITNFEDLEWEVWARATGKEPQIITSLTLLTSSGFGGVFERVDNDNAQFVISDTGLVALASAGGWTPLGSGEFSTNPEIRIKGKPRVHTDLAVQQNNGGYDQEFTHDLALSAPTDWDLDAFFTQPTNTEWSWEWYNGDSSFTAAWLVTGSKTIGGVDAVTLMSHMSGQGQGRLTLRKDGTDSARLIEFEDSDGGLFTNGSWEKHTNGKQFGDIISYQMAGNTDTIDHPIPFIATPSVQATVDNTDPRWVNALNASTTQVTLEGFTDTGAGAAPRVNVNWSGRWTNLYPRKG
jgi:hypothetical protein